MWPASGPCAFSTSRLAIPSAPSTSPSRASSRCWTSPRSARGSKATPRFPTARTSPGTPGSILGPRRASAPASSSAVWGRRDPPARGHAAPRSPTCSLHRPAPSRMQRPPGTSPSSWTGESSRCRSTPISAWRSWAGRCPSLRGASTGSCWPSCGARHEARDPKPRRPKQCDTRRAMRPSERLQRIPPYAFAELERKIAARRAAGADVISLGIGDPDRPTPPLIVEAMQEAVSEPETHRYPSNRGREDFRSAVRDFYERRFDVRLDPEREIVPAIGAKEAIFNLNLAFLDPGDYALAADPGYPVYTGGPWLAGAAPVLMALQPEHGFVPDLAAIDADVARRAKLMYLNYPNNPTGAVVPDGFFERVIEYARAYDILVVHDNAYSEITFDGYRAPSFLSTPGAKEVGIEIFSLSKGYNMTGWRCAVAVGNASALETYWRLKTNIDSGLFDAVQLAAVAGLAPEADQEVASMKELYLRRRDLVCEALRAIGVSVRPPHGTIYVWAPVPDGFASSAEYCAHVLERAAVVLSPGAIYGPAGEGWFRISLTTPDDRLLEAVNRLAALAL